MSSGGSSAEQPRPAGSRRAPPGTRIAYVSEDRQIRVVAPDGSGDAQVTFPEGGAGGMNWGVRAGRESRTWPCWSPDGRWIACFLHPQGEDVGAPATVCVVEVDGVEERQLVDLQGQLPIYCQWSPRGDRLGVLGQEEDELQLWVCDVDKVGYRRVIEEGIPLFFTWTPDGQRILVHAGTRRTPRGRLVVRSGGPAGHDQLFPLQPGSFCTPYYVAGRLVFGVAREGGTSLCVAGPRGESPRELLAFDGLVSFVPSPRGDAVVASHAPGGESSPYQGVWLVPLDGGPPRRVAADPCLAFYWDGSGQRLLIAGWDTPSAALWWDLVDLDSLDRLRLATFLPTRDQLFHLHFYEQFSVSHPLVSADGGHLVYASHGTGRGDRGLDSPARVMVVDLYEPRPRPRELVGGAFGVFSPPSAPSKA